MKKVIILTSLMVPELLDYDQELMHQLKSLGLNVDFVVWETEKEKLIGSDLVIFRSTWGYHLKINEFKEFLDFLDENKIKSLNPTNIIRKNLHKFYLKELRDSGFDILDTIFVDINSNQSIIEIIREDWDKFIIKPAISAASSDTYLFDKTSLEKASEVFNELYRNGDILLQRFYPEVKNGEISTIFFNRNFHYSVRKTPMKNDYRVQSTFGGFYEVIHPEKHILEAVKNAAYQFIDNCLYVRVDGLVVDNRFRIMEIELIEPDLYLNIFPDGIPVLANEILKRL